MAFLRRTFSLFGRLDRLYKSPINSSLMMPKASCLHTMESSGNGSQTSFIPTLINEQPNYIYQPILSISKTVNNFQILPSLPRSQNAILDLPALPMKFNLEMPTTKAHLNNFHIMPEKVKMEDPQPSVQIKKHAERMVVIRRRKIKKHLRKKAFKKNRITYSRIKQARKALKERNLQLKLLAQLSEGRNFSPQKYAFDLLTAAYEKVELPARLKKKRPWEV